MEAIEVIEVTVALEEVMVVLEEVIQAVMEVLEVMEAIEVKEAKGLVADQVISTKVAGPLYLLENSKLRFTYNK